MIAVAAVVWKLKTINAITAIVGTSPVRIYAGRAPAGAQLPYIVVDNPPGQDNLGEHAQGQGSFRKTPIVVFCFADKDTGGLNQAGSLATIVEAALEPTSGFNASVQWNGTWIDHCSLNGSYQYIQDNAVEGEEVGWRAMAVPVTVFHLNCSN